MNANAQKYEIYVDTVQQFEHDPKYTINQAIGLEKIKYTSSSTTQLKYVFDLDSLTMTRQYRTDPINLLKIIKITRNPNNLMEVYVVFDDGVRNYLLTEDKNTKNGYVFVSRTIDDNKVSGWFDSNIEIKKRP